MAKSSVAVLMYHALTEKPESEVHRVHIPVADFEEQMDWLAAEAYQVLPLKALVTSLKQGRSLPEKSVVLTFDDGYLSLYNYARPILHKHGFEATLFVTTDPVGLPAYSNLKGFDGAGQPSNDRPLTWPELAEMAEMGWAIESHSCSHPQLAQLNNAQMQHETRDCKKIIEAKLNRPVQYYAYPFGNYNRQSLAAITEAGYEAACSVHVGKTSLQSDVLRLPRVEINSADGLPTFIRKVETGYASDREKLRSRARNVLYASPIVKDLLSGVKGV